MSVPVVNFYHVLCQQEQFYERACTGMFNLCPDDIPDGSSYHRNTYFPTFPTTFLTAQSTTYSTTFKSTYKTTNFSTIPQTHPTAFSTTYPSTKFAS